MHFLALRGINKTAWGAKLLLTTALARGLYQFISNTDGTSLMFNVVEAQIVALTQLQLPSCPPAMDSIRDITETEKTF